MESVKHCADQTCNTDLVIIPGGCTSILQAPDISCNKPFKGKYTELWNEWSASGEKTYTPAGIILEPLLEKHVFAGSRNLGHSSRKKPYYDLSSVQE